MQSDFLSKFKGRTNKISKQGINNLFDASNNSQHKNYTIIRKKQYNQSESYISHHNHDSFMQVLKQKININQQPRKINSITSGNLNNRQKSYIPPRQVVTGKQKQKQNKSKSRILQDSFKLPELIKLPKINKEDKVSYHSPQNKSNNKIKQFREIKAKKSLFTEVTEQVDHQFSDFTGLFLDNDANQQLKKLNQFEMMIQKKVNINEKLLNRHNDCCRKGYTMHY